MLDEARLYYPRQVVETADRPPSTSGSDLMARVIAGWRIIAAVTCLGAALAVGWSMTATPVYVATAEIFIDPRNIQALDAPGGPNQGDNNAQVSFVESQARIVVSEGVLARAVEAEKLADDPFFNGEASSPIAHWMQVLGLQKPKPTTEAERTRAAIIALGDRVTVRRPERTFVMDVSVKANQPEKAAALANAVAQAYFDQQNAAYADMAHRAATVLTSRLDDLRGRVREAETRVQAFKTAHGLVGTRAQLSSEQQLTDANAQLAQAQGRVVIAQARLDEAQRLTSTGAEGTTPEAVNSPTISLLRGQQAEARRRLDNALEQLGPRHPTVRDAQAEVDGLQRSIAAELGRLGQAARVEFRRAQSAQAAQKLTVDRLSEQAQKTSDALLQLNQLEREVDINKNLLDTFLSRARQVAELSGTNTSDGRVISMGLPPQQRSFPPRGLTILILGAVLGLAAGTALAARPWAPR
jgi:uncharacterized protein involved in exopolysaccharide biosynthesis